MLPIRTERLILRAFTPADAPAFAAYRSDQEVARYQSWTPPFTLAAAVELISKMQSRDLASPRPGEWNQIALQLEIPPPDLPSLIGDCAFQLHPDDARQANIGFTLARSHQRRGYAGEAVRALLSALFGTLNLHRVTAVCDADNHVCQRVLERVGMRREAHFVRNIHFKGEWGSEFAYAMLRDEWRDR